MIADDIEATSHDLELPLREAAGSKALLAREQEARAEAERAHQDMINMLERIDESFVALDTKWCYSYVNEKAAQTFGRTPADLIGKHIWTEFPDGVGLPFYHAYYRAMAEQTPIYLEEYYPPYDRWFENRIYPSPEGLSIFFRDITERKRFEQRMALLESVARILIEARGYAEAQQRLLRALCETLGYDIAEVWEVDRAHQTIHLAEEWHIASIEAEAFVRRGRALPFGQGQGLPGRTWQREQTAWIDDIAADTNFPRAPEALSIGLRSALGFPIIVRGEVVSVILALSRASKQTDAALLKTITDFGVRLGQWLERERAEEARQRQNELLTALQATTLDLVQQLDLNELLQTIIERAGALAGTGHGNILLVEPDGSALVLKVGTGIERGFIGARVLPGEGLSGKVWQRGETIAIDDYRIWEGRRDGAAHDIFRACAAVPLKTGDRVVGVLTLDYLEEGRTFGSEELRVLEQFAQLASIALHNARLYEAAQQEISQRAAEIDRFFSVSLDLLCIADSDAYFRRLNPAWTETLGYTAEELMAKPFLAFVHPDDLEATIAEAGKLLGGDYQTVKFENRYQHKDGSYRWLRWSSTVYGGLFYAVAHDVTALKQAEEEIRKAKEEAEAANAAKSEFLSRMSHELRTPMNAILGFGQLLEMGDPEPLTPMQRAHVQQILNGGRHLLELINEVLDISRIESGHLQVSLEPVRVRDVVNELFDLCAPMLPRRQVQLVAPAANLPDMDVLADNQRLKQVLLNLLSNAIKYNRQDGQVRLDWAPRPGPMLRINVRDTGVGITPEKMARLFSPFDRLGAEQSEVEGTGLGLALSRRLIEVMNGTIGADSAPGEGSTFWIELPLAESPLKRHEQAATPHPLAVETGAAHTILYIEDNRSNFELVKQLLARQTGVAPIWAIEGEIGLRMARELRPDLILLDLHLPDMHGSDVLDQLRSDPATRAIPVVVVSADATPRQIERLKAAGANAYLTKPLDVRAFITVVKRLMNEAR